MGYFDEFRKEWRALLGAFLGLAGGLSITTTITNVMGPELLKAFHWTKEQFAAIAVISLVLWVFIPVAGRLADVWGVRRTAAIGVFSFPVFLILFSLMTGDIRQYYVLYALQAIVCIPATATVYSRVIVERFQRARGLALGIVVSGYAVTGLFLGPILTGFSISHGWRAGYQATAVFVLVVGVIALLLIPSHKPAEVAVARRRSTARDYRVIFRHPAFWLIFVAVLLVNLPQVLAIQQLALVLIAHGVPQTAQGTGMMLGLLFGATITGRLLSGFLLDRMPAYLIAFVGLALPGVGMFLIVSHIDSMPILMAAVILVGLAFGSEGDVVGYLVSRIFPVEVYGSVYGLTTAAVSIATASGAALLALIKGYDTFLLIAGTASLAGSLLFLLIPWATRKGSTAEIAAAEPSAA